MTMTEWAENEIKLACVKEKDTKDSDFEYAKMCYDSALKAYKSMSEDGHSGMSWQITSKILIRLLKALPLTPVTEKDKWIQITENDKGTLFQSCRISSLFKRVDTDGNITYSDNDRVSCFDKNDVSFGFGLVGSIIDEMFPITLPYYPTEKGYRVFVEDFLTKDGKGDFDTVGIMYAYKPNGERIEINRFFKEEEHKMVEIEEVEYKERLANKR